MMNAVYISVVLVFILILSRKQILPYLKRKKEKKEDMSSALSLSREVILPCYKVLGFRVTDYITTYDLVRDVEYKLGQSLEEIADRGGDPSKMFQSMSAGNVMLILLRYPDKKISYSSTPDIQKEGGEK